MVEYVQRQPDYAFSSPEADPRMRELMRLPSIRLQDIENETMGKDDPDMGLNAVIQDMLNRETQAAAEARISDLRDRMYQEEVRSMVLDNAAPLAALGTAFSSPDSPAREQAMGMEGEELPAEWQPAFVAPMQEKISRLFGFSTDEDMVDGPAPEAERVMERNPTLAEAMRGGVTGIEEPGAIDKTASAIAFGSAQAVTEAANNIGYVAGALGFDDAEEYLGDVDLAEYLQLNPPGSPGYEMLATATQFIVGWTAVGKVGKGAAALARISGLAKGAQQTDTALRAAARGLGKGAATDALFFDPYQKRLSALQEDFPALEPIMSDWLASSDPDDPRWIGMAKNAIEGLIPGVVVEGVVYGMRSAVKSLRKGRPERGLPDADGLDRTVEKEVAAERKAVEDVLDVTAGVQRVNAAEGSLRAEDVAEALRPKRDVHAVMREVFVDGPTAASHFRQSARTEIVGKTIINAAIEGKGNQWYDVLFARRTYLEAEPEQFKQIVEGQERALRGIVNHKLLPEADKDTLRDTVDMWREVRKLIDDGVDTPETRRMAAGLADRTMRMLKYSDAEETLREPFDLARGPEPTEGVMQEPPPITRFEQEYTEAMDLYRTQKQENLPETIGRRDAVLSARAQAQRGEIDTDEHAVMRGLRGTHREPGDIPTAAETGRAKEMGQFRKGGYEQVAPQEFQRYADSLEAWHEAPSAQTRTALDTARAELQDAYDFAIRGGMSKASADAAEAYAGLKPQKAESISAQVAEQARTGEDYLAAKVANIPRRRRRAVKGLSVELNALTQPGILDAINLNPKMRANLAEANLLARRLAFNVSQTGDVDTKLLAQARKHMKSLREYTGSRPPTPDEIDLVPNSPIGRTDPEPASPSGTVVKEPLTGAEAEKAMGEGWGQNSVQDAEFAAREPSLQARMKPDEQAMRQDPTMRVRKITVRRGASRTFAKITEDVGEARGKTPCP